MDTETQSERASQRQPRVISWERDIALLTNRRVLAGTAGMALLAPAIVVGLLAIPLRFAGEWGAVSKFALLGLGGTFVLLLISLIVLTIVTGNRYRLKFRVDDKGVSVAVTDRRARAIHRGTFVAGLLGGSAAATGAGTLAAASETQHAPWCRVLSVRYDPRAHVIDLRGSWRSLAVLYCPPERYEEISATVAWHVAATRTSGQLRNGWSTTSICWWKTSERRSLRKTSTTEPVVRTVPSSSR